MPLTDTAIRAAKPSERQQKLFDGSGLFLLLVFPNGSKVWRFKQTPEDIFGPYRDGGVEIIALAHYAQRVRKEAA